MNATTHYVIRGIACARVTHVIAQFRPSETVYPPSTAAADGTAMHAKIEAMLKGDTTTPFPLKSQVRLRTPAAADTHPAPQVQACINTHINPAEWRLDAAERCVSDTAWRIAGTVDALFLHRTSGKRMLVDWKRTKGLWPESAEIYQLQLNIYAAILARSAEPVDVMALALFHPSNAAFKWVVVPAINVDLYTHNAHTLSPPPSSPPPSSAPPAIACLLVFNQQK